MKLIDRELIEGTSLTIGRRVQYIDGKAVPSPRYSAEYRDALGKQIAESLKTKSRLEARKKALAIHARLEAGESRIIDSRLSLVELIDDYFAMTKGKGIAPGTIKTYSTGLAKLKAFAAANRITLALAFDRPCFYRFRESLVAEGFAAKTIYTLLTITKQVFKWGWQEKRLRDYPLSTALLVPAKAAPQPCFTTDQVEQLIQHTTGVEQAAIATLAFAGLRIGEVVQLHWSDVRLSKTGGMLHIRRGGSNGTTKDKDARFVPIHPRIRALVGELTHEGPLVFPGIFESTLLRRVKTLCVALKFPAGKAFKLHSFRHHFASLCANHRVAERKALAWLGHSESGILRLYYHLSDADSIAAMQQLADDTALAVDTAVVELKPDVLPVPAMLAEGEARATGQSTIETDLDVRINAALTILFGEEPENARLSGGLRRVGLTQQNVRTGVRPAAGKRASGGVLHWPSTCRHVVSHKPAQLLACEGFVLKPTRAGRRVSGSFGMFIQNPLRIAQGEKTTMRRHHSAFIAATALVALAGLVPTQTFAAVVGTKVITDGAHFGRRGIAGNTVTSFTPAPNAGFGASIRWVSVSGTLTSTNAAAWARSLRVQPSGTSLATGPGTPKGQGYFQFSPQYEFSTVNVSTLIAIPGGIAANVPITFENYSVDSEDPAEGVPGVDGKSTLTYTFYNSIPNGGAEFSGSLTASDPKYNRAVNYNGDPDGPVISDISATGTAVSYDVQPFTVSADGTYAIAIAGSFDTEVMLYADSFDPANALTNFVDGNDSGRNTLRRSSLGSLDVDNDTNGISRLDKPLLAGVQYYAVTTSYANGQTGDYFAQIGGPGAVTLGTIVPEPTTIGLLIAAGAMSRRRR